jgi:hypothetical protein
MIISLAFNPMSALPNRVMLPCHEIQRNFVAPNRPVRIRRAPEQCKVRPEVKPLDAASCGLALCAPTGAMMT